MAIHRLLIDCAGPHKQGLRTDDADLAARWSREAPVNAKAHGHLAAPLVLHFDPAHGDEHGDALIRSVHRLHADIVRDANGAPHVRALYHYPDREPDDTSGRCTQHPLLTKRQWAQVPAVATRSHRILKGE